MNRNPSFVAVLAVSICSLLFSSHTFSFDKPDYVDAAKSRLLELDEADPRSEWFYTITTHLDDEIVVLQNNPLKEIGARRELVSVNGESPTVERLKEFEDREIARQDENDDETIRVEFGDIVDVSTLELLAVENGQALLSFSPNMEEFEKHQDKMEGTLRLNTDTQLIDEIIVFNTEKISPAFSVSVKKFSMKLLFSVVDGETLLARMATTVKGKAGFLKKFESSTEMIFSDYRRTP